MSLKQATDKVCSKCGLRKPLTEQFWYFKQSGPRRGKTTGYCRHCQNAYCRRYDQEIVRVAIRRDAQRDPARYRDAVYAALLDGMTADQVADQVAG